MGAPFISQPLACHASATLDCRRREMEIDLRGRQLSLPATVLKRGKESWNAQALQRLTLLI